VPHVKSIVRQKSKFDAPRGGTYLDSQENNPYLYNSKIYTALALYI